MLKKESVPRAAAWCFTKYGTVHGLRTMAILCGGYVLPHDYAPIIVTLDRPEDVNGQPSSAAEEHFTRKSTALYLSPNLCS
jgi:hypothetical protein